MATRCLSNAKQLGTGVLIYTADYDDRFMLRDEWMDALSPYLKDEELKHCPAVQVESKKNPTLFGYAFNSKLSGIDSSKVIKPTEVPLLYDSINLARNASDPVNSLPDPSRMHGQSRSNIVAYADSHVKRLRPKDAE